MRIFYDVDTQKDFIDENGKLSVKAMEIRENLKRLTQYARKQRIPILGSVDWHEKSDGEMSEEPDFKETFPYHCLIGTAGVEKIPETAPENPLWIDSQGNFESERGYQSLEEALKEHKGEIFLRKNRFDVFSNPFTEYVLKNLGVKEAVVYGVATEVCDDFAVKGLRRLGIEVYAVTDAMKAIDEENGKKTFDVWKKLGVKLVKTQEALENKF